MNKNKIDDFVEKCSKSIRDAKAEIEILSKDEYVEIKAYLEVEAVHSDKYVTLLIPYISIAFVVLGFSSNTFNSFWINIGAFSIFFLLLVVIFAQMKLNMKRSKELKVLCYLEEYFQKDKANKNNGYVSHSKIKTYEDLIENQKEKRKRMLVRWKEEQKFANKQIELFEKNLDELDGK